jgi:hypothetical protein
MMRIPKIFVPEKDLEDKINELVEPKQMSEVKRIVEAREFYADRTDKALASLFKENYEPLLMPFIVDARVEASGDERVWKAWYCSPSVVATGKTKQGKGVVVFAHVPNYFFEPTNITKAIEEGLIGGAGRMPRAEFERLLGLEDNRSVFVVDYKALKKAGSGAISVGKALRHPLVVPFLGGEERAERYLDRHAEVYGKEISVWYGDVLGEVPVGRLLFVGDIFINGLIGYYYLFNNGRFVGVRKSAEGATQKIVLALDP